MNRNSFTGPGHDDRDQHCDLDDLALLAMGEEVDLDTEHLAACGQCRSEAASLRRVVRTMRTVSPADSPNAPPANVWTAIQQQMASDTSSDQETGDAAVLATVIPLRSRKAPWIALAAVVGLFFGGIVGASVISTETVAPSLVAQAALEPLPGFTTSGTAQVEQTDAGEMLAVDLTGLPPAEDGYFEVWLITSESDSMISLGAVGAGGSTRLPIPQGLALDRYSMVDVSAERFDGDATHSTISVVRGTLDT
jgi:hypothetical protein